jgi:hypothetical protein
VNKMEIINNICGSSCLKGSSYTLTFSNSKFINNKCKSSRCSYGGAL